MKLHTANSHVQELIIWYMDYSLSLTPTKAILWPFLFSILNFILGVFGIEARASETAGVCSATELHPQSHLWPFSKLLYWEGKALRFK